MKICFFIIGIILSANVFADKIDNELASLETILGSYPPAISSDAQKKEVTEKYENLKRKLDRFLEKTPDNEKVLYQRGLLQSFGHNMDYPDAWNGADADLRAVLIMNPSNVRAILDLANLYVNSNPELAPKAELLYKGAQCYFGSTPEEETQRGLFFAYYYQGKMDLAYKQSLFLNNLWPKNGYEKYVEIAIAVLKRNNEQVEEYKPSQLSLSTCKNSELNS